MKEKINNTLNWSSNLLGTDLHYIARGGSWLSINTVTASLISLFMAIVFARLLPKDVYGVYKYILSVAGIIGTFSLTGIGAMVTRSVARGFEGSLKQGFYLTLKWGVLPFLLAMSGAIYYYTKENITLSLGMVVIGILTPILSSTELFRSFIRGKKDFKKFFIFSATENIIASTVLVITILITKNPVWMVTAFLVSNSILHLISYLLTLKIYKPNELIDDEASVKYGKHLSFIKVLGNIAVNLDNILIFHYVGAVELAIYSFAVAIPNKLKSFTKIASTLALPRFAEREKGLVKKNIFKKVWILAVSTAFLVLIYILFAPFIYKILFPEYTASILFSQVFALVLIVNASLLGAFFNAHSALKETYILNLFSSTSRIVLVFALVIPYGIWGVIAGRLIAQTLSFALILYLTKKV